MQKVDAATAPPVPKCGSSDKRNIEYEQAFSPKRFFDELIQSPSPMIVDVGAHRGESILFFKNLYPASTIISFEPDPDNFKELLLVSEKFGTKSNQTAIAEDEGDCFFYKQDISHLGGLLPINNESSDSLGYASNAKNEKILVHKTSLDKYCILNNICKINILKVDVQGFEVGVLKGATNILANTDCVSVEISLYDFYGENNNFFEVESIMRKAGFSIWDFSKLSKNPKNFRTDWVEVVYRNDRLVQAK